MNDYWLGKHKGRTVKIVHLSASLFQAPRLWGKKLMWSGRGKKSWENWGEPPRYRPSSLVILFHVRSVFFLTISEPGTGYLSPSRLSTKDGEKRARKIVYHGKFLAKTSIASIQHTFFKIPYLFELQDSDHFIKVKGKLIFSEPSKIDRIQYKQPYFKRGFDLATRHTYLCKCSLTGVKISKLAGRSWYKSTNLFKTDRQWFSELTLRGKTIN